MPDTSTPALFRSEHVLAEVLTCAGRSAGHELDLGRALQAVRTSLQEGNSTPWPAVLAAAGEQVGLHFFHARRGLEEVSRMANPTSVWVTLLLDGEEVKDAVVVRDRRGSRVAVQYATKGPHDEWVEVSELNRRLAGVEEEGRLDWVMVEAAAPLAEVKPEHGEEEEEGHHGVPPVLRLRGWLSAERNDLWVAVIYSIAIGLLSLVVPVATQSLVNTIAFGTLVQPLVILTLLVLVGLGLSTVLQSLRTWVVEIIQRRVFVRVSTDVVYRLLRARAEAFDHYHGPELVNRFFEVVTVQKAGAILLVDGLSIFMQSAIGMILLAVYHPWLLAFDVLLLATILFVLFPMGRGAIGTAVKESKAKYALAAWLEEVARHPLTFRSARGAAYALERTDGLVSQYLTYRAKHFRILMRQIVGSLAMHAFASATLLGVGGWLVIQRQLTLGQLIAAELVVALVVSGFSKFGKQLETFYDLAAAIDKLGYLTDLPLETAAGEPLARREKGASLRMRNVGFSFEGARPLFEGMNLEIPAGARIGVLGQSGKGKSTLLDILYGLREPTEGVVEIDDRDYRDVKRGDLRTHVALVRHIEIFHGSIADNVRLSHFRATSADIREALRSVGLLEEIQALPEGIHTDLATGGLPLSPGQAIRLMLARAVLSQPRLLILDECLDQIDDARERERILDTLFAPDAPWTLLVVTSSPDVLARCACVYALDKELRKQ